ncbi:hypothetical protein FRZ06_20045 [Anoxybacterium hadale]|uniref:Uncharacterized protein n=1 Tax=Anoxybacterium hadale TaxID=3408580 RepID=A0ACD1AG70_9FIRM|nr:hypothetical protein FRZ06_20045 [Clostridiales bacterium]
MNRFKQKTGKRVLSFMLVLALLIPMIPAPVFAAEPTPAEKLNGMVNTLLAYRDEALGLTESLLESPCVDKTCDDYGKVDCTELDHRLLVDRTKFDAAVVQFADYINRDIDIVKQLTSGAITGYTYVNNSGAAYYTGTAANTVAKKVDAAISFLESGGYQCGEKSYFIGVPTGWKKQLGFKSSFNPGFDVHFLTGASNENAVIPLAEGFLNILRAGASPDAAELVYNMKVRQIESYIDRAEKLEALPAGGTLTPDEFNAAVSTFINNANRDLEVASILKSKTLNKDYASAKPIDFNSLNSDYGKLSENDRYKNVITFFSTGGFNFSNLLGVNFIVYKSVFYPDYSDGLFGIGVSKADALVIMSDTIAALELGMPYMSALDLAKMKYAESRERLLAIKNNPDGIVATLLSNDQELRQLIADLNMIIGSLDDIISTVETLERLGIGADVLDTILSPMGLSYNDLKQLASLRELLNNAGIDTSGEVSLEDSFEDVAGALVRGAIDLSIGGADALVAVNPNSASAYKNAKAIIDQTYSSLMEDALKEIYNKLGAIIIVIEPVRPYLGMINSTVSLVKNMAVLVEQVDALQDDFTVGGLSVATYTTAGTLDNLANFLVAFDAAGLGEKLSGLLENSNLGGTVADGTAAMLNQLIKELIKQDVGLSGSDLGIIQRTVDSLTKAGLDNPTALVPMLRASADVLRRAAELEGGIQDAIDGNYESAWNVLTKDLGGMFSKTVTLWNSIVALYEKPEVQQFTAFTMDHKTGELNLDSLEKDEFLQAFGAGINEEAQATFKILIDPKCSDSEKLTSCYKFYYFLKDVKTFVADLEAASKCLNDACKWAEENLSREEAKAFIENMGRHYAAELRACIQDGLSSSSIKAVCREIEDSVSEMRDLLNYIKCTGDLEITATPGEGSAFYTFGTNYDALRVRLDSLLRTLGISTGYKVNSPAEQFTVDGNKLVAIGDLEDGQYKVKVAYQMYFAVCDRDFASTLATKWVTVNISGGGEEPDEALTGIEITALPHKISYRVGESLNLTGLQVMAHFDDETEKLLDLADCNITPEAGTRLTLEGIQPVTISYAGFSDSFEITVKEAKADIYQVRFDTDGGFLLNGASETETVEAGSDIELPWVEKMGHSFKGWFDADGTYQGNSGEFYRVRSDVEFFAHWKAIEGKKEFTVTFDPNGGTFSAGMPASVTKQEGEVIPLPVVTRSGYTFDGWYSGKSFIGKANDVYTVYQNITLTAGWSRNSTGGGGGSSSSTQIVDEAIPLGGIYSLMSLPAEPKDGIVYYVDADGNTVFVPFCYPIGDKIYFLGQVGIKYLVKANPKQFGDITGNWAYDNILAIASREAFQGYPDSSFQPGSPMTRAMLSAVLARMAMVDTSSYKTRVFDDVSPDAWYGPSVAWALEQGIVTGVGGKQFNPNANITRQEFSVMLARFISYMSISLPSETAAPFADEDMASDWAKTAIADMKKYNIVTGRSGNLFDPYSDITRAEITTMLYRLIQTSITYGYENSLKETKKAN